SGDSTQRRAAVPQLPDFSQRGLLGRVRFEVLAVSSQPGAEGHALHPTLRRTGLTVFAMSGPIESRSAVGRPADTCGLSSGPCPPSPPPLPDSLPSSTTSLTSS